MRHSTRIKAFAIAILSVAAPLRADIFQWEYINPADPSQGKRPSTTLTPDGAGVNAVPGADLAGRDLTMAHLIGAALVFPGQTQNCFPCRPARTSSLFGTNLTSADLTNARIDGATLTGANFTGAVVRGATLGKLWTLNGPNVVGTGITLSQLYSTASYRAGDLSGIGLYGNDLAGANFTGQYLTNANFGQATLTDADFTNSQMQEANLSWSKLTNANFTGANVQGVDFRYASLAPAQLYSTASYRARDLTGVGLAFNDLSGWNFAGQNLTDADLSDGPLTDADLTGADVAGANLRNTRITLTQLYSTTSYQTRALTGIGLGINDLSGGNFEHQNLSHADFYSTTLTNATLREANLTNTNFLAALLDNADFSGAEVRGANFNRAGDCVFCLPIGTGIALPQLYSTASYQTGDLSRTTFDGNYLVGVNFAGQNLADASFFQTTLTDANFSDAEILGANFRAFNFGGQGETGITLAQLYSTASYRTQNLTGISLSGNYLVDGNFAGQNLTNANFLGANLTNADFRHSNLTNAFFDIANLMGANFAGVNLANVNFDRATLMGADLTAADVRGPFTLDIPDATTINLIFPDGHVDGLELNVGGLLIVRDYDGNPTYSIGSIPITVDDHLAMGPGGTLRMIFEADVWDSTISFAPGIPVKLGGTLELTFADDVNLASLVGRTFDLFDWTGVTPTGAFAVSSPYSWDLSNLYTTGEITLTSIPEPASLTLVGLVLLRLVYCRRGGRRPKSGRQASRTLAAHRRAAFACRLVARSGG